MTKFKPPLDIVEVEEAFTKSVGKECEIVRKIKEGGQGSVFEACIDDKRVALKICSADYVEHRAKREVDILEKLRSPFVAKLYGSGFLDIRNERCFYSSSIFIEGEDLQERLKKTRLTVSQTETLIRNIISVIDEMWSHRIVHCDITPKNVMINDKGNFILIDLGIAKHLDAGITSKANLIWGTSGYLAPEQLTGRKNLTLRVDLFALGIVAYEAVTGNHPFNRNQSLIGKSIPPPVSDSVPSAQHLDKVIGRMLNFSPIRRPRSGSEVIDLLGGVS